MFKGLVPNSDRAAFIFVTKLVKVAVSLSLRIYAMMRRCHKDVEIYIHAFLTSGLGTEEC